MMSRTRKSKPTTSGKFKISFSGTDNMTKKKKHLKL